MRVVQVIKCIGRMPHLTHEQMRGASLTRGELEQHARKAGSDAEDEPHDTPGSHHQPGPTESRCTPPEDAIARQTRRAEQAHDEELEVRAANPARITKRGHAGRAP